MIVWNIGFSLSFIQLTSWEYQKDIVNEFMQTSYSWDFVTVSSKKHLLRCRTMVWHVFLLLITFVSLAVSRTASRLFALTWLAGTLTKPAQSGHVIFERIFGVENFDIRKVDVTNNLFTFHSTCVQPVTKNVYIPYRCNDWLYF